MDTLLGLFLWVAVTSGEPLIEYLSRAGGAAVLAVAVIAFLRGWIVPGRRFDEMKAERDRAIAIAERHAEIADRALTALLETAIDNRKAGE